MILRFLASCILLLVSIFHKSHAEVLHAYHCGIGPVSKVASYVLSLPCGREKLNKCCFKHDRCYDHNYQAEELVLRGCDTEFEECIEHAYKRQSWICAKYLEFTHSGAVRLFSGIYRNVFGYDPTDQIMQTDTESMRNNGTGRVIRANRHKNRTN